ncbi:MAG TPA: alpha/beta hydrolase fold domain-containing protein [Jatrophihabitans sp.]
MKSLNLPFALAGRLNGLLERPGLGGPLPIWAQRRWLELIAAGLPEPAGTLVRPVALGGRPALRVTVGATERPRAIVHLHGGAYTVGSPRAYRSMAAYLAEAAGAVVYLPDYRLAPENPYPAALNDAVAAFADAAGRHPRVGISGDSAGGGLAVAATRRLLDSRLPAPRSMTLASPWVDPTALSDGPKRDLIVRESWGVRCAAAYVGSADPHDPGIAPIYGSLAGMPPSLVHVSTSEVLYGQVSRFVEALRAAGVDVSAREQRLWHAGHASAGILREARDAVIEFGEFHRKALD